MIQLFCVPTEDQEEGDFESPKLGDDKTARKKPSAKEKKENPKEDNKEMGESEKKVLVCKT